MESGIDENVWKFVKDWVQDGDPRDYVFFHNVGMDGIDADFFMGEFAKAFDVDMADFVFTRYAMEEGDMLNVPKILYWRLFKPHKLPYLTFGVGHLVEVAKAKRWFDPQS